MLCYWAGLVLEKNEMSSIDSSWDIVLSQRVIFSDLGPFFVHFTESADY